MGAYGYIDNALAGMKADNQSGYSKVSSKMAIEKIAFGKPVFSDVGENEKISNLYNDVAKIVYDADFVTSNSIAFSVNGTAITPVVYATSHAATMTALKTAIDALTGVEAVVDTSDTNGRTLLVRKAGGNITVTSTVTLGASQATATITYQTAQVFQGIALFVQKNTATINDTEYEQYEEVPVLSRGEVWVLAAAAVKAEDEAFIVVSGADKGKFSNTGDACGCKFKSTTTGAGLVQIEVNGTYRPYSEITF